MSKEEMSAVVSAVVGALGTTNPAVVAAAKPNGKAKATVKAAAPDGNKVAWRKKSASKPRGEREDYRRPETLRVIAKTQDGQQVTTGVTDRGTFGVQVGDGTIVYHMRSTWGMLASVAAIAYAAMMEHYES